MNLILRTFGGNTVEETPLGKSVISLMQQAEDDMYSVNGGHSLLSSDNMDKFKKNVVFMLAKIRENGIQEHHKIAIEKCIAILKSLPVIEFFHVMTEIDRLSLDREPDSLSDIALRYLLQDKALSARLTNIHRIASIADIMSIQNINALRKNVRYLKAQIVHTLFSEDDLDEEAD